MRRTEVLQGLRRMKFEDVYGRWQQRRLSQAEAAEILGMSERTFRRWRDRYEDEGPRAADRRLGKASARRVPVDQVDERADALSRALPRVHRQALPRQAAPAPRLHPRLHLDQAPAAGRRPGAKGAAPRGAPQEAAAATLARDAAAPGRLTPSLAAGARSGARPDRDHGRCHQRDLLGLPGRRGRHHEQLPGARRGDRRPWPAVRALHRPREPLLPSPPRPARRSPRIS